MSLMGEVVELPTPDPQRFGPGRVIIFHPDGRREELPLVSATIHVDYSGDRK